MTISEGLISHEDEGTTSGRLDAALNCLFSETSRKEIRKMRCRYNDSHRVVNMAPKKISQLPSTEDRQSARHAN